MKTSAKFGCAILGAAIAVAIASSAHAVEELVDVTKNPGCGVKLKTKEEKVARNKRLADALDQQAFCALQASPGARAYYDRQKARGATHHQALRALGNRLVGILHGCLKTQTHYKEHTAWQTLTAAA